MIHLYNDDAMSVLKNIEDNSISLIITDPPYKCISGGRPKKDGQPSGILSKNDGKIFEHNNIEPEIWMPELYRVLKEESHCYIMTNVLNMEKYLRIARETGFKLHNILVWEKNNATPSRWYMKNGEYTLFLRKGKAKPIKNIGNYKTIHQFKNIIGNKLHPCQKPGDLFELYLLNSSNEGDSVLDPFMGAGTCGRVCKKHNRIFYGSEIDTKYFDIATKSIDNITPIIKE